MISAFQQSHSRDSGASTAQNTVLSSRRTRIVANDLFANVELRRMKAEATMRDVMTPPADARVAGFRIWYAKVSGPEFDRMQTHKFTMHSLASRTEMLLGDALKEANAKSSNTARCLRRTPARYNKDVAFKLHEAVLRNIETLRDDMATLDMRIKDTQTTSMQLRLDMDVAQQPYTVSAAQLPLAVRNPWPAGPQLIVVKDVMEFTDLQKLVAEYTKRITSLRRDLEPTLATWNALHRTADVLLTKESAQRHKAADRLARMKSALKTEVREV